MDGFGVAMLVEAGIVLAVAALVLAFMPSLEVVGLREESEMAGPSSVPAHGDD